MPSGSESRQAKLLREFGLGDDDLAAWERSERPRDEFEDWLTDQVTRRPAGAHAREVYGADDAHHFARARRDPGGVPARAGRPIARNRLRRRARASRRYAHGGASVAVANDGGGGSITLRTERNHIANTLTKLDVHSQLQAVVFALRYDVVTIG